MSLIPPGLDRDWYEVNAKQLSKHCLARGRYEIAEEFHKLNMRWYEVNVVNYRDPNDSAEDRKNYRALLAECKAYVKEFGLLVKSRERIIQNLVGHAAGIDRNELKKLVEHDGVTTFGVICNQLDRGGWLRQQKQANRYILYPASTPPQSDQEFFESEIPTPT